MVNLPTLYRVRFAILPDDTRKWARECFQNQITFPELTETVVVKDSKEEKLKSKSQGGKLG